nr:neprilysin-2-like [Dermacentor andersoni]
MKTRMKAIQSTVHFNICAMNFKAILITAWIWFPALATAYGTDSETFPICESAECLERAQLINESLNASADPCQDFYSYVCSRWESSHQSEITKGSYDVNEEIGKGIPEKLSYVLGNRTLVEVKQTIVDKVKATYNACLGKLRYYARAELMNA